MFIYNKLLLTLDGILIELHQHFELHNKIRIIISALNSDYLIQTMYKGLGIQGNAECRRTDRYKRFKRTTITRLSKMKSSSQLYAVQTNNKMSKEMMTLRTKIMTRNSYNLHKSLSFSDSEERADLEQPEIDVELELSAEIDVFDVKDCRDSIEIEKNNGDINQRKALLSKKKMAKELFTLRSKLMTRNAYNLQTKGDSFSDGEEYLDLDLEDENTRSAKTTNDKSLSRSDEKENSAEQLRKFLTKNKLAKELFTLRSRMIKKSASSFQQSKEKSLSMNDLEDSTDNKTTLNELSNEKSLTLEYRRESVPNKFRLKLKEHLNDKCKLVSKTISKYSCSNIPDKTPLILDDTTNITQNLGDLQISDEDHTENFCSDENENIESFRSDENENEPDESNDEEQYHIDGINEQLSEVVEEPDKNVVVNGNFKNRKLKKLLTNLDLRKLMKSDVLLVEKSNDDATGLLDGD